MENKFIVSAGLIFALIALPLKLPAQNLRMDNSMYEVCTNTTLLQNDSTYQFYISRILPIQNGILIEGITYDLGFYPIFAHIVFPHRTAWLGNTAIRIGKTYPLRLNRYTESYPLRPVEGYAIDNILLGDNLLRIEARGLYSFLFSSLDLSKYPTSADCRAKFLRNFNQEKDSISHTVQNYLNALVNEDEYSKLAAFADTSSLKRSFKKYSYAFINYKGEKDYRNRIPHKNVPVWKWEETYGINPNNFTEIMNQIALLDFYSDKDDSLQAIEIVSMKLLFAEKKTYTFRVIWKRTHGPSELESAIMTIGNKGKTWKITGMKRRTLEEKKRDYLQKYYFPFPVQE